MGQIARKQTQLTFPGFKATPTGLIPNKTLSLDQWDSAGHALSHIEGRLMWFIGDWLLSVREKWEQGSLAEICENYDLNYHTANHAGTTCRAIEFSRRRPNLSFAHHDEVANRDDADELLDWAEENDASVKELRQEKRRRAKALAAEKAGDLPAGKYNVIYADPPWEYGDKDPGALTGGGCEQHYSTMTLEALCELEVPAADDAVLFLWVTCPLLPEALDLVAAWGFDYRAQFVWDKVKHNMGHYNSVRHELLLICIKGSFTPQEIKLQDSVQVVERNGHSEKPAIFRKIIEGLYPKSKKLELFARSKHKGWKAWGNEA